jgi:hypothetical protein
VLSSGIVITRRSASAPAWSTGEDIFLARAPWLRYNSALSDMVAQARAATVMGFVQKPHGAAAWLVSCARRQCAHPAVASKTGLSVTFGVSRINTCASSGYDLHAALFRRQTACITDHLFSALSDFGFHD